MAQDCQPQIDGAWLAQETREGQVPVDESWQRVTLPDLWEKHWPGYTGAVWYRVNWHNDCASQPVALNVDRMVMAGQVFLNGDLFWQDESLAEPLSRSWNKPRYWLLPQSLLTQENTLLFRLVSAVHPGPGLGTVRLGTPEQLLPEYHQQQWQQRGLFTVNLTISLVLAGLFFVLWLLRRDERAFGWFALASLLWSITISNVLIDSAWPFAQGVIWDRISLSAGTLYCCAFCMFTWNFGGMRFPRLARLLWGGSVAACVVIWLTPEQHLQTLQVICALGYWTIFIGNCVQFLHRAWQTRLPDHLVLGLCLLSFLLIITLDGLGILGLIKIHQDLRPLSAPLMSIAMFLIIAWRFAGNLRRIAAFNDELQQAVISTREELARTLTREHQLEVDNIRLNERLHLTHDLHDSMGSSLMRSMIFTEQSHNLSQPHFLSMLRSLRDDLRHVIDGTSTNAGLDGGSPTEWIAPLRRRFVMLFDGLGITSHWNMPEQWPFPLASGQRLALIRFIEEALSNAIKHSGANYLSIVMQTPADGEVSLCIEDNGRGFDVAQVMREGAGIGMSSMHARIARIGGQLDIDSSPGQTRVSVRLSHEAVQR